MTLGSGRIVGDVVIAVAVSGITINITFAIHWAQKRFCRRSQNYGAARRADAMAEAGASRVDDS